MFSQGVADKVCARNFRNQVSYDNVNYVINDLLFFADPGTH